MVMVIAGYPVLASLAGWISFRPLEWISFRALLTSLRESALNPFTTETVLHLDPLNFQVKVLNQRSAFSP